MRTNTNSRPNYSTMRRRRRFAALRENSLFSFMAVGIVSVFVTVLVYNGVQYLAPGEATCTVIAKDFSQATDSKGNTHGVYRIATSDCGVMEVRDNIFRFKFDSADTYYQIQQGHRYHFTYTGIRFPLFSGFPGIISATEVSR